MCAQLYPALLILKKIIQVCMHCWGLGVRHACHGICVKLSLCAVGVVKGKKHAGRGVCVMVRGPLWQLSGVWTNFDQDIKPLLHPPALVESLFFCVS